MPIWQFSDAVVIEADHNKATLKYRGKTYGLTNKDIPDIIKTGVVKIKIISSMFLNELTITGARGVNCIQLGKKVSINGIDIHELIKKLSEKK